MTSDLIDLVQYKESLKNSEKRMLIFFDKYVHQVLNNERW